MVSELLNLSQSRAFQQWIDSDALSSRRRAEASWGFVLFVWFAVSDYTGFMSIFRDLAGIAKGMSVTLREMFSPTVVEDYPNKKLPNEGAVFQERFRGLHELQRDENGLEKCVACFLCAAACPSNCIYIEAAENTEEHRISGAERYAKVYNIDYNRCIFCGYCVEACPTDAITHGHGFEVATFNASNLVYRKEALLVPMPVRIPAPPAVASQISA